MGQHEAALADYDHIVELNPNQASAYLARGKIKEQLGRFE
jgi:regulator of sirC expression with transglutaminase-like and TPR domain